MDHIDILVVIFFFYSSGLVILRWQNHGFHFLTTKIYIVIILNIRVAT